MARGVAELERIKGARLVGPLQRPDETLITVGEELPTQYRTETFFEISDLHIGFEDIEDVIPFGTTHTNLARAAATDLAHVLALHVEFEPWVDVIAKTQAETLEQPRGILRAVDRAVEVEIIVSHFIAHLFLHIDRELFPQLDGGVGRRWRSERETGHGRCRSRGFGSGSLGECQRGGRKQKRE